MLEQAAMSVNLLGQQTQTITMMTIFRECWTVLPQEEKADFARVLFERAKASIVKGDVDYNMREVIVKHVTALEVLATPEAHNLLSAAVIEKAVKMIAGSTEDRYNDEGTRNLHTAIREKAEWLVGPIALEKAPEIEARLTEAITDKLLDRSVQDAARRYTEKLQEMIKKEEKTPGG